MQSLTRKLIEQIDAILAQPALCGHMATIEYSDRECPDCSKLRPAKCLMCGRAYGGKCGGSTLLLQVKAMCGCEGHGAECWTLGSRPDKNEDYHTGSQCYVSGHPCNLDPEKMACFNCRPK